VYVVWVELDVRIAPQSTQSAPQDADNVHLLENLEPQDVSLGI